MHWFSKSWFSRSVCAGDGLGNLEEAPISAVTNSGAIQDLATSMQQTSSHALETLQASAIDVHATAGPLADDMCQHAICSTSQIIGDLASALDAKLAFVQHLDPEATSTLSESMALISDAMKEALESNASPLAEQTARGIGAYLQNLTFQLKDAQSSSAVMQALRSFVPPLGPGSQGTIPQFQRTAPAPTRRDS